jgi:hypothetical protein
MVALPQPPTHHNPYLTMGEMPPFLGKLRRYGGDINTKLGIRLLLLTGVRTLELRSATPEQFKLDAGLWIIPCGIVKGEGNRLSRGSCLSIRGGIKCTYTENYTCFLVKKPQKLTPDINF